MVRAPAVSAQKHLVVQTAFKKVVPRKPLTACARWMSENPKLLAKSSIIDVKRQYSALPQDDRKALEKRCAEELEKFKQKRKVTRQDTPAKPMSSYMIFCAEKKAEVMETVGERGAGRAGPALWKESAQQWKALSARGKQSYQKEYAVLAEVYAAEMEAFKGAKKQRRTFMAASKHPEAPATPRKPKRPPNGYVIFSAEKRREITEELINNGQDRATILTSFTKEAASRWNDLSEEDQKVYHEKSQARRAQYLAELGGSEAA